MFDYSFLVERVTSFGSRLELISSTNNELQKEVKSCCLKHFEVSCSLWFTSKVLLTIETNNWYILKVRRVFFSGRVTLSWCCTNANSRHYLREAKRGSNKHYNHDRDIIIVTLFWHVIAAHTQHTNDYQELYCVSFNEFNGAIKCFFW